MTGLGNLTLTGAKVAGLVGSEWAFSAFINWSGCLADAGLLLLASAAAAAALVKVGETRARAALLAPCS